jgi:hypothetical protein
MSFLMAMANLSRRDASRARYCMSSLRREGPGGNASIMSPRSVLMIV